LFWREKTLADIVSKSQATYTSLMISDSKHGLNFGNE